MPEKGQGAHPRKCTWSCEADPVDWRSTWLGSGWVMVGLWSAGVSLVTFWSWTAPANPARYYEVCLQDDLNAVSLILPQSPGKWESETLGNLLKGTQHVHCRVRIQSRVPLTLNLVLLTVTLSRLSINEWRSELNSSGGISISSFWPGCLCLLCQLIFCSSFSVQLKEALPYPFFSVSFSLYYSTYYILPHSWIPCKDITSLNRFYDLESRTHVDGCYIVCFPPHILSPFPLCSASWEADWNGQDQRPLCPRASSWVWPMGALEGTEGGKKMRVGCFWPQPPSCRCLGPATSLPYRQLWGDALHTALSASTARPP